MQRKIRKQRTPDKNAVPHTSILANKTNSNNINKIGCGQCVCVCVWWVTGRFNNKRLCYTRTTENDNGGKYRNLVLIIKCTSHLGDSPFLYVRVWSWYKNEYREYSSGATPDMHETWNIKVEATVELWVTNKILNIENKVILTHLNGTKIWDCIRLVNMSLTSWPWQDLSSTMLVWNDSSRQSKTVKASYSLIDSWLEDYLLEAFQQGQWEPVTFSPVVLQHRGLRSRAHPKSSTIHLSRYRSLRGKRTLLVKKTGLISCPFLPWPHWYILYKEWIDGW